MASHSNLRRPRAVLAAVALVAILAACGQDADGNGPAAGPGNDTTTTIEPTTTTEPAHDPHGDHPVPELTPEETAARAERNVQAGLAGTSWDVRSVDHHGTTLDPAAAPRPVVVSYDAGGLVGGNDGCNAWGLQADGQVISTLIACMDSWDGEDAIKAIAVAGEPTLDGDVLVLDAGELGGAELHRAG